MPDDTVTIDIGEDGPMWVRTNGMTLYAGEQAEVNRGTGELLAKTYDAVVVVDDEPSPSQDTDAFLDEWFESPYSDRAEKIENGLADGYLDAIEEETQSQTELDAIDRRRDELSEG